MHKLIIVVLAGALALAGCSSVAAPAPGATVEMGANTCAVSPAEGLPAGQVTFTIHNATADEVAFQVKEDDDTNQVGVLLLQPQTTEPLTVHFDHGDEYVTHCGDVQGATFKP